MFAHSINGLVLGHFPGTFSSFSYSDWCVDP